MENLIASTVKLTDVYVSTRLSLWSGNSFTNFKENFDTLQTKYPNHPWDEESCKSVTWIRLDACVATYSIGLVSR